MLRWRVGRLNRKPESQTPLDSGETDEAVTRHLQIEVNLLPSEYVPTGLYNLRNIFFLILSFLILTFLAVDVFQITMREKEFSQRKQDMLKLMANLGPFKQKVEALKKQANLLNERRNELAEVIDRRMTWSDKLSQVYAQIPSGVWLSEISVERNNRKASLAATPNDKSKSATQINESPIVYLHILGEAKDIKNIAELIARLETIPFLEKAPFRSINREQARSANQEQADHLVMSFEIIARVNTEGNIK